MAKILIDVNYKIGKISPDIYGHYLEHWGRCIYDGLWAEMLKSRKFAENDGENAATYGIVQPWFAINRNDLMHFMHDNTEYFTGRQSQKIILNEKDDKSHGIAQGNLWLVKDRKYKLTLNIKQKGLKGPITISIGNKEHVFDSHVLKKIDEDWCRIEFELISSQNEKNGILSITFINSGVLWLGTISLMPKDNYYGIRKDVLEAIKELKPAHIRWPGGNFASSYHWQNGIGDRDKRMPVFDPSWQVWDTNDFGTDEFLKVCEYVNTKPYICVNNGDGTTEEAAQWVEYCNGSINTKFGKLRADNGHIKPYNIKLWGIGNEMFGNWQIGHVDERTHAEKYLKMAQSMRATDPELEFVAPGGRHWHYPEWNKALFDVASDCLDHISIHSYAKRYRSKFKDESSYIEDAKLVEEIYFYALAANYGVELHLSKVQKEIDTNKKCSKRIHVAFDEWNIQLHRDKKNHEVHDFRLRDALYAAGVFQALQRQCNAVKIATLVQLVNTLGIIRTNHEGIWLTPIYWTSKLFTEYSGEIALNTKVESDTFLNPGYEPDDPPGRKDIPYISAQGTLSNDGENLFISIINRYINKNVSINIFIDNWKPKPEAELLQIDGPDYMSLNTYENKNTITVKKEKINNISSNFKFLSPAHSVSIIECCAVDKDK
jgi:alpha-N-arabinofuranosidase